MGKLHVGSADYLHRFHDLIRLLLKTLLALFGYGQHGRGTERISCMNAHGIDIFDEADGDHVIVCVTNDLKL